MDINSRIGIVSKNMSNASLFQGYVLDCHNIEEVTPMYGVHVGPRAY
jgi:hypothetical protein